MTSEEWLQAVAMDGNKKYPEIKLFLMGVDVSTGDANVTVASNMSNDEVDGIVGGYLESSHDERSVTPIRSN